MEENQQAFQPIIIDEGKDSVMQRSTSGVDGLYIHQTLYHVSMVTNIIELPSSPKNPHLVAMGMGLLS